MTAMVVEWHGIYSIIADMKLRRQNVRRMEYRYIDDAAAAIPFSGALTETIVAMQLSRKHTYRNQKYWRRRAFFYSDRSDGV